MKAIQYNRRNFLTSAAILSVGSAFGSGLKHFSTNNAGNDLQKDWSKFWKRSGGRIYQSLTNFNSANNRKDTKGHSYKYGEIIYFPKENILAQPTWVFWNDGTRCADVIVTLFENNHAHNPIIRFNRYEMDSLYRLSKEPGSEELLLAFCNNSKRMAGNSAGIVKTKTNIKKNSGIQDISYYKEQQLIFKNTIILNS
ncbi:MAG: hypothetical protein ABI416_01675 [Ginsengibacter sp.]